MRNVLFLGLISFFTDLSTEMVYPLIPVYLLSMGAGPALMGLIEGISESLASLLKVYSGYITDKSQKKKLIAFWGYASGFFYKIALLLATTWVGILSARVLDKLGKGIRTTPRDVLISESADKDSMGKAFGLHKALDKYGAAMGILLTYFILRSFANSGDTISEQAPQIEISYIKNLFFISMIPAVLGLMMFYFVKERKIVRVESERTVFWKDFRKINNQLKLYLIVVFIFTLGNSSKAFFLLKAHYVGFNTLDVILLYFVYNIVAGIFSMPFGKMSDKYGRKNLLVPGYISFALCYIGFAFASNMVMIVLVFVLYGIYTAMITGVERAFVSEVSPIKLKGTMLGLHSTISGIALLPASIIAGLLWSIFDNSSAPFIFGASMSIVATIILIVFMKSNSKSSAQQVV